MNLPATINPTHTAEHIKSSIELTIDDINTHTNSCPTCKRLDNRAARIVCPDGNNLWAALDQAIALEAITAQI